MLALNSPLADNSDVASVHLIHYHDKHYYDNMPCIDINGNIYEWESMLPVGIKIIKWENTTNGPQNVR